MHPFPKVNTRKLICSAPGCIVGKDHSLRERECVCVYVCEKEKERKGAFFHIRQRKGASVLCKHQFN